MVRQSWAGAMPAERGFNSRHEAVSILRIQQAPGSGHVSGGQISGRDANDPSGESSRSQNRAARAHLGRNSLNSDLADRSTPRLGFRGLFGQPVSLRDLLTTKELDVQIDADLDDTLPPGDLPGQLLLDLGLMGR